MQRLNLGLNQKSYGASNPVTTVSIGIGSSKSKVGSTARIFNYCKEHSPAPSLCINQFVNITNNNINNNINNNNSNIYILDNETTKTIGNHLTVEQVALAYNIPRYIKPIIKSVYITIIVAYHHPNIISDLNEFVLYNYFPSPKPPPVTNNNIEIINLGKNLPNQNVLPINSNNGYLTSLECSADIQWAYAINPYAKIRVIEAISEQSDDLFNAVKYANNLTPTSDIISLSYGIPNAYGVKYNSVFNNTKICYIAASGDNSIPLYPSSYPNVLAIGASALNLKTGPSGYMRDSEILWSKSGCGLTPFSRPSYQPQIIKNNLRTVPDFCAVGGTQVFIFTNGQISGFFGSSVSAPIVAGILSLLIQTRYNNGLTKPLTTVQKPPISSIQIQPILYKNYKNIFYDITQGKSNPFSAAKGFDIASGMGVIKDVTQFIRYFMQHS